jgi:hypothetical protein
MSFPLRAGAQAAPFHSVPAARERIHNLLQHSEITRLCAIRVRQQGVEKNAGAFFEAVGLGGVRGWMCSLAIAFLKSVAPVASDSGWTMATPWPSWPVLPDNGNTLRTRSFTVIVAGEPK